MIMKTLSLLAFLSHRLVEVWFPTCILPTFISSVAPPGPLFTNVWIMVEHPTLS